MDNRPALTGYGIFKDYKVVTDSYHLIAIKEDNMCKAVLNKPERV